MHIDRMIIFHFLVLHNCVLFSPFIIRLYLLINNKRGHNSLTWPPQEQKHQR